MVSGPPVIGLVGPSGVGKTTLLEQLVAALDRSGVRVGVVKHASDDVEVDRPGKDSHRLYAAGAGAVALAMPSQIATFARRVQSRPRLADAIATLPAGLDLILVEGFQWDTQPRYVLLPHDGADDREYATSGEVIRVLRAPLRSIEAPPQFPEERVAELVREIETRLSDLAAGTPTS